jgi:hypothetical protein
MVKLRPVTRHIKKPELYPTRNEFIGGARFKEIPGVNKEFVELRLWLLLTGGALNELCRVPGDGAAL